MKRLLVLAAVVAAGALVLVSVTSSARPTRHHSHGGKRIHVIEHATTDTVVDLGDPGDSAGDTLTFANQVYDRTDSHQVGSDQGSCVRTVAGAAWECSWTTFLPGGQITVEGPFYDADSSKVAITGGTGRYRNSRGWMHLSAHDPAGTEFDFVFHVIG